MPIKLDDVIESRDLRPQGVPRMTLVTAPGCHFCEDAHTVLTGLVHQGRIELAVAEAESVEGESLVGLHRPALFPLALLDGGFFSAGRLPRRKLAAALGVDGSAR